jgi:hypothetical protein
VIVSTSFKCFSVSFPFFLSILASDSADDTILRTLEISELAVVQKKEGGEMRRFLASKTFTSWEGDI